MIQILLETVAFLLMGAAYAVLAWRMAGLAGRIESIRARCGDRLDALAAALEQLGESGGATDDLRAEERRRALEAERRFTEGVANILSFSYNTAVKRSE